LNTIYPTITRSKYKIEFLLRFTLILCALASTEPKNTFFLFTSLAKVRTLPDDMTSLVLLESARSLWLMRVTRRLAMRKEDYVASSVSCRLAQALSTETRNTFRSHYVSVGQHFNQSFVGSRDHPRDDTMALSDTSPAVANVSAMFHAEFRMKLKGAASLSQKELRDRVGSVVVFKCKEQGKNKIEPFNIA